MQTVPSFEDLMSGIYTASDTAKAAREARRPLHETLLEAFDKPMQCANPCYQEWRDWATDVVYTGTHVEFDSLGSDLGYRRHKVVEEYSWAIPTRDAIDLCIDASGGFIVEVGSGSGYWASLLEKHGCDIIAVDTYKEYPLAKHFPKTIQQDGTEYLLTHDGCADRALFLCWPRHTDEIIDAFKGNIVIWIGEPGEGCTGTIDEDEWEQQVVYEIPRWFGIHDHLVVFHRIQ